MRKLLIALALVAVIAAPVLAGTKSEWRGARLEYYESANQERILPLAQFYFYDDFCGPGSAVIPAAGSAESGVAWVKKIVGAAPPTVAQVADQSCGLVACTLTSADQKQDAAIYWGDERSVDLSKKPVFEARVKLSVLPTDVVTFVIGLASDWADDANTIAYAARFEGVGSGLVYCAVDDASTDTRATSGVTCLNTDWKVYRIDLSDLTNVKFYINGARVAGSTTFPYTATGANAILQPFLGVSKAGGCGVASTGVGTMQVDYVRVWQNRQ